MRFWKKKEVEEVKVSPPTEVKEHPNRVRVKENGDISAFIRESSTSFYSSVCFMKEKIFKKEDIIFLSEDHDSFAAEVQYSIREHQLPMTEKSNTIEKTYKTIIVYEWAPRSYDSGYIEIKRTDPALVSEQIIKTPVEAFREAGHFGLIETEEEFSTYLNSPLNINAWSYKKLYNELFVTIGVDASWIAENADYIGTDWQKYEVMLNLALESYGNIELFKFLFSKAFIQKK